MPPRVFFQPYEFMLCAKLRRDNMPSCFCFIFFSVSGALSLFNPGRECVPICFVIYIRYTSRTQRPFLFHSVSPYIPLNFDQSFGHLVAGLNRGRSPDPSAVLCFNRPYLPRRVVRSCFFQYRRRSFQFRVEAPLCHRPVVTEADDAVDLVELNPEYHAVRHPAFFASHFCSPYI